MPIPWLTVLKSVPWIEVIRNAPQVAEAARRLWLTIRSEPRADASALTPAMRPPSPTASEHAVLRARVDALTGEVKALHEQVVASSELIKQLAEQQAGLVARVELNRRRTIVLAVTTVIGFAAAVTAIWLSRAH